MTLSIGLDFGTTNTVATMLNAQGAVEAVHFAHEQEAFDAFRSVLCFSETDDAVGAALLARWPMAFPVLVWEPQELLAQWEYGQVQGAVLVELPHSIST